MKGKHAFVVSMVLFATFVGTVFAESTSLSGPASALTPQTTSVDVEVFHTVFGETNGVQLLSCNPASTCGNVRSANLTSAFAFAPLKNFIQVNSAIVTIIYSQVSSSTPSANTDALSVEVNGHSPSTIGMIILCSSCSSSALLPVPPQTLKVGANIVNIGIASAASLNPSQAFIFEVRLTIEYTFLG